MSDIRKFASTSNLLRFILKKADTGLPLTGLTFSSTGLIISTIADVEATATAYTTTGSTIETITTLGTFATPTATKCRFKEVDATNHPGLYEFQFDNARYAISSPATARKLVITVSGVTNLFTTDYEIELVSFDPFDAVKLGLTRVVANADQIAGNATSATNLSQSAIAIYVGSVTGATPSATTLVDTGLGAKADNFYKDRSIVFITGNQKYQLKDITGYVGSTDTLTFTAMTAASAQGDSYVIL